MSIAIPPRNNTSSLLHLEVRDSAFRTKHPIWKAICHGEETPRLLRVSKCVFYRCFSAPSRHHSLILFLVLRSKREGWVSRPSILFSRFCIDPLALDHCWSPCLSSRVALALYKRQASAQRHEQPARCSFDTPTHSAARHGGIQFMQGRAVNRQPDKPHRDVQARKQERDAQNGIARRNKLRQEGKIKQGHLWIQQICEQPLQVASSPPGACFCRTLCKIQARGGGLSPGTQQGAHSEIEQIRGAGPLHNFKRACRLRQNRRKPECGRRCMHEQSRADSRNRGERSFPASCKHILSHQRHVCARGDGQYGGYSRKRQIPRVHFLSPRKVLSSRVRFTLKARAPRHEFSRSC